MRTACHGSSAPHRSRHTRRAALLAFALLALAGCRAERSRVLARVGARAITLDDFVEAARENKVHYPGPADSAKALLLDDLVRRALVLTEAERLGMYRDTAVRTYRRQVESEVLQQAMYREMVPGDVPMSDAELRQLYAWRDSAARVQAIFFGNRGAANAAAAELARGTPFAEVADRMGSPGVLPPGGDLGYRSPGSLVRALDRYLRAGPLRTPIGPVESPGEGWFILQVLERRKRAQPPFDEQRLVLRDVLRQRKQAALRLSGFASLRESYRLRPEPGGAQAMFAYFHGPDSTGGDTAGMLRPERSTVLMRYQAGRTPAAYTLADALADLGVYGREKPAISMIPSIEQWLDSQALRRIAELEARRRHLEEEPANRRKIEQRIDNFALEVFYSTEVEPNAEPGPGDVREAYERSRQSYQRLDEVELLVATLRDSATAAELFAHAGHAPTLREAVQMAAAGAPVREERVRYPDAPARWKPYQAALMDMKPHECLGPLEMGRRWIVAQMVSKRQEAQSFDRLPPAIVQLLHQQATEIRRDRTFNHITDRLRQQYRPEIHAERLQAIPWLAATTAAPASP
ncbi:MAG TPA: peptidylprolyl isomerase [Candidatus Eisenbacteria bacterium]|jgi:parvulin-like peptidyl-prolyl isomerase